MPCVPCIVLVASPGQSLLLAGPLNGTEILIDTGAAAAGAAEAVRAVAEAGGQPGLVLPSVGASFSLPDVPPLRRVAVRVAFGEGSGSIDERVFRLKTQLVEVRSTAPQALVGIITGTADWQALAERDIASYIDFHSIEAQRPVPVPLSASAFARGPAMTVVPTPGKSEVARWFVRLPEDVIRARAAVRDLASSRELLPDGLIAGGMVDIACGGSRLSTYLDAQSLATVAIAPPSCAVSVSVEVPGTLRVRLSGGETVIRVPSAEGHFAAGVRVDARQVLTVREIIARHQAAAARQRRAVRQLISTGTMTLTFEAPAFPAPIAITSQVSIYTAADATDIEQRDIRVNGIAFAGGRVPRLPLIEPERVASPPLAIALTDLYTYRLDGEATVAGVRCYTVSFTPVDRRRTLFSGTAWIATDSFAMIKVSAVQTGLRGPIVSSEQTDEFSLDTAGHWLLARSEVRQLYEGAGFRTPIHRVLAIGRQDVNPPLFIERRRQAYASAAVMLRDTPQGFRYLLRESPGTGKSTASPDAAASAPVPRLAGAAQRVRTIALGVIVDPNISTPLPFAGLSYIDFNLFGTGTQLNGFFGGSYGQLAVSVPSLAGTRWQLAGRAFGIASWYNDRAFVDGREHYEWNISQRPAHASAWVLRPLTPRLTMRAGYELDYTGFDASDSTAATFTVPPAQVSHGLRLALDGQWRGWSPAVWWVGARRSGWRRWGETEAYPAVVGVGEYREQQRDYQRAGATLARSMVLSPRLVGRVEAAYMTGWDLDRFSRYTFGSFDNRLRGYPSALIRYDRGAVVRGAVAWSAGRMLRLDGFADTAYVHDPAFGRGHRRYSGVGGAAEIPAPFGTLVAVEWGYGFQGVNADGRRGTQVLRITGYKIF